MNPIDSFPPDDTPLRARLPAMRPETAARLIQWALEQPGAMPWLLKRAALYWDKDVRDFAPALSPDQLHTAIEATAALDLLRHRLQCADDKQAVEHITLPLRPHDQR